MEKSEFKKFKLSNGITVVTELMPFLRSVSIGVWVKTGSRSEDSSNNGISHFLEHLAFKGTKTRSAYQIALEVDGIGGVVDAYTSKEHTAYSAKILDERLSVAVDILSDILINSVFDPSEIEKERKVILEEIKMVDDSPSDYLYDLFSQNVWSGHPLGMPIQGDEKSVNGLSREIILDYLAKNYHTENLIISVAGNFKYEELHDLLERSFSSFPTAQAKKENKPPVFTQNLQLQKRKLEQVHIYIATEGIKSSDDDRYKAYILNIILGGGMSSRLFQEIREERGLAYTIYSFNNLYEDSGLSGIYAATSPKTVNLTTDLIFKELKKIVENKVEKAELNRAKEQLKGNITLSLDSSGSRMNQLAREEMCFGRHSTIDEIYSGIENVTVENVQEMAKRLFKNKPFTLAALGDLKGDEVSKDMLIV